MALHEKAIGYRIGAVVSNKPDAAGLEWARNRGIPTRALSRGAYESIAAFKDAILAEVVRTNPSFVALAGFMMLVPPSFIEAFAGRLVNIHPSLLPKFPGLDTHARALAADETEHGCTVMFVDNGVDTGPVIAQCAVPVKTGDTAETLAARTLEKEHELYPWVISHLALGNIRLEGRTVRYSAKAQAEAVERGFRLPSQ